MAALAGNNHFTNSLGSTASNLINHHHHQQQPQQQVTIARDDASGKLHYLLLDQHANQLITKKGHHGGQHQQSHSMPTTPTHKNSPGNSIILIHPNGKLAPFFGANSPAGQGLLQLSPVPVKNRSNGKTNRMNALLQPQQQQQQQQKQLDKPVRKGKNSKSPSPLKAMATLNGHHGHSNQFSLNHHQVQEVPTTGNIKVETTKSPTSGIKRQLSNSLKQENKAEVVQPASAVNLVPFYERQPLTKISVREARLKSKRMARMATMSRYNSVELSSNLSDDKLPASLANGDHEYQNGGGHHGDEDYFDDFDRCGDGGEEGDEDNESDHSIHEMGPRDNFMQFIQSVLPPRPLQSRQPKAKVSFLAQFGLLTKRQYCEVALQQSLRFDPSKEPEQLHLRLDAGEKWLANVPSEEAKVDHSRSFHLEPSDLSPDCKILNDDGVEEGQQIEEMDKTTFAKWLDLVPNTSQSAKLRAELSWMTVLRNRHQRKRLRNGVYVGPLINNLSEQVLKSWLPKLVESTLQSSQHDSHRRTILLARINSFLNEPFPFDPSDEERELFDQGKFRPNGFNDDEEDDRFEECDSKNDLMPAPPDPVDHHLSDHSDYTSSQSKRIKLDHSNASTASHLKRRESTASTEDRLEDDNPLVIQCDDSSPKPFDNYASNTSNVTNFSVPNAVQTYSLSSSSSALPQSAITSTAVDNHNHSNNNNFHDSAHASKHVLPSSSSISSTTTSMPNTNSVSLLAVNKQFAQDFHESVLLETQKQMQATSTPAASAVNSSTALANNHFSVQQQGAPNGLSVTPTIIYGDNHHQQQQQQTSLQCNGSNTAIAGNQFNLGQMINNIKCKFPIRKNDLFQSHSSLPLSRSRQNDDTRSNAQVARQDERNSHAQTVFE